MSAVTTTPPMRVVIIDDTADLRDLLRIAMTRGGFEVVGEAGDGSAGIETVRLHHPDIVLLDLAMPVMDGLEALPSIRRLCPSAKIVVLSGFGAQQMSVRAIAAGADGYVQKGAPLNTILDYVRDIAADNRTAARGLSSVPSHEAPAPDATPDPPDTDQTVPPSAGVPAKAITWGPVVVGADPSAAEAPHNVSSWEAMRMAPYGVVELTDEPLFRLVHANPVGARLLGTDVAGTPLAVAAPDLASMLAFHRLDSDATFETTLNGGQVRVALRRTGWSVMVFLDSAAEDVGLLRRAIATTAHEVRGPVAVLCGIAETLAWDSDQMTIDQTRRLMDSVARQARILDRITADLLTAAEIQRGTLRIDHQVVDPRSLVTGAIEDRWDVEIAIEDERSVRADPLRLEQMVTNLLSNAHKYGAAPFVVRVRPDGQHVAIDVVDHGAGVPVEFRDDLFREFARASGAVATGTGLGLFVVRTLAQAQNGSVSYSPGPAGGSVFTIKMLAC